MANEIITLQFGNYSNYLAAHYWNIQENQFCYSSDNNTVIPDVNHDVLFREGISGKNRITFTPRMLLYDLKENINVFRTANNSQFDKDKANVFTWGSENTQVIEETHNKQSDFITDLDKYEVEQLRAESENKKAPSSVLRDEYNMEEQVKYWTDYLKVKYHEKSYNTVDQYQQSNKDTDPFDLFHYGLNVSSEHGFMDTFEDKLRQFSEECDRLQGFQFMVDAYNGFGGISSKCFDIVKEEYRKKSIFAILPFPSFDNQQKENKMSRMINTSFTLKTLLEDQSDVMALPISLSESFFASSKSKYVDLPAVNFQPNLHYHTSAVLASLIDSVTLPWRQKSQVADMPNFFNFFDCYKYKLVSLQSVYPLKIDSDKYLLNYLQNTDICKSASWFTPLCYQYRSSKPELTSEDLLSGVFSVCSNGVDDKAVKNIADNFAFKGIVPAKDVLEKYFIDMYPKSNNVSFSSKTGLCTKLPFPNIINEAYLTTDKSKGPKPNTASLITIIQLNKSITPMLESISDSLKKCNVNQYPKYFQNGMEYDDFTELKNFSEDLLNSFSD